MRRVFIFFSFLILFSYRIEAQQLIGNIISTSTNQPCISVGASLSNNSQAFFQCSTATVLQLSLSPSNSQQTSSATYIFRALPDSTGTYNQNFFDSSQNPLSEDPINACFGNVNPTACQSAIENENLFQIEISISAIPARYQLSQTGLVFPSFYYYDSRPYPMTQWTPTDTCGIDPYSDIITTSSGYNNYAKATNTVAIPKANITGPGSVEYSSISASKIFSNIVLSEYALQSPGSAVMPPVECSALDLSGCTWSLTSIGELGETAVFNDNGTPIPYNIYDGIFNRFLNGTLGAGGAFSPNRFPSGALTDLGNSFFFCTQPINNGAFSYTKNICPLDPLPNFQARKSSGLSSSAIYPSYCINGPCGGDSEAFCALIAGFKYGSSRCLMSKNSALRYMDHQLQNMISWPNNAFGICQNLIGTPFFTSVYPYYGNVQPNNFKCDSKTFNPTPSLWTNNTCMGDKYSCIMYAYLFGSQETPDTADAIRTFQNAIDSNICGTYIANITRNPSVKFGNNINVNGTIPYPLSLHSSLAYFTGPGPVFYLDYLNNVPQSVFLGLGSSLSGEPTGAINDIRQLVVPFQPYSGTTNVPVGISLSEESLFSNGAVVSFFDPLITTSPSTCTAASGWQDTVIPIGPLCTAYTISNPPTPLYEVNITLKDNFGNPTCIVTIGTAAGPQKTEIVSGACNNSLAAWIINADMPKGNTMPILDGYIVICDAIPNDEQNGASPNSFSFFGGGDPSGLNNPWLKIPAGQRVGRMPIPSTFEQMFGSDCTTSGVNNAYCAWWYYVPANELNQYGVNCNQNGWMNYGAFSTDSTNTMCENALGTCVPGYDVRNYNCKNYNINSSDPLFGFPTFCPTTKTPGFIGRQLVDFEVQNNANTLGTSIPVNVPPGWNSVSPNWWVDGTFLYTDSEGNGGGPAYAEGDIFIRLKLAIAGELITTSTSYAPGKLRYSSDPTITTQPLGTCNLYIESGGGTLVTYVQNTGVTTGTYTLSGNCTNGASVQNDFSFSVNSGNIVQVNLALGFTFTNGNTVTCNVNLAPAFTNYLFDTLSYQCLMYNTINDAPGSIVYSTTSINDHSIDDGGGYGSGGWADNGDCTGDNPPWWCIKFKGFNSFMSFLWMLIAFFAIAVVMISITYWTVNHTNALRKDFKLRNQAMKGQLTEELVKLKTQQKATQELEVIRKEARELSLEEKLQSQKAAVSQ